MIGLSAKTFYAVAALYDLDSREEGKATKIKDIAISANIPQNFLEQILLELKKSGILLSVKGAYGGYKLNRDLSEITLANVVEIVEDSYFESVCKTQNYALKQFWNSFKEKSYTNFDIPLSELKKYEDINGNLDYVI